jgi:hypothetical protein
VHLPGLTFWTQITFVYHIGIAAHAQFKAINGLQFTFTGRPVSSQLTQ